MTSIGKFALAASAMILVAACAKQYESPAQHASDRGQPAVGLSSDPVTYSSTGAIVSEAPRYGEPGYPGYAARTPYYYYPAYPVARTYPAYPSYPVARTCYYPCAADTAYGTSYAMAVSAQDRQFLVEAMDATVVELELARIAYDRARSPAVRDYAAQVMDSRSELASRLDAIALRRGVAIRPAVPPIPGDLAYRSGRDFDSAYMDLALQAQDRTLRLFDRGARLASDPEIRAVSASAVPTLQVHGDMALRIEAQTD